MYSFFNSDHNFPFATKGSLPSQKRMNIWKSTTLPFLGTHCQLLTFLCQIYPQYQGNFAIYITPPCFGTCPSVLASQIVQWRCTDSDDHDQDCPRCYCSGGRTTSQRQVELMMLAPPFGSIALASTERCPPQNNVNLSRINLISFLQAS